MRVIEGILFEIVGKEILDDAAHLHIRKSECLRHILKTAGLLDGLFEDFSVEFGDGAVRPDGAGAHTDDVVASLDERDLDIGILPAFLREDLDPDVVIFVGGLAVVVAIHLTIEDDRRGSGSERLAGHLQLFRGNGLKAQACANRGRRILTRDQNKQYGTACYYNYATKRHFELPSACDYQYAPPPPLVRDPI